LPAIHWCGAGVIGETLDSHLEPANADDALYHADLNPRFIEGSALLDV
jgi:hypothetical protein